MMIVYMYMSYHVIAKEVHTCCHMGWASINIMLGLQTLHLILRCLDYFEPLRAKSRAQNSLQKGVELIYTLCNVLLPMCLKNCIFTSCTCMWNVINTERSYLNSTAVEYEGNKHFSCDLSRKKGPHAKIINFEKTGIFYIFAKIIDF